MRQWISAAAALVIAATVGPFGGPVGGPPSATAAVHQVNAPHAQVPGGTADKPNIIFVLADDLSANLVPYMRNVQQLQRQGTSFSRYTVADSLCCPSRATIFTGNYPHNTGVLTNTNDHGHGGYPQFRDDEGRTFAVNLDEAGYRTGFMGKYMNGYQVPKDYHVPAGWDEWHAVSGGGYNEFNYDITRYIKLGDKTTKERQHMRDGLTDNDPKTGPDHSYTTDVLGQRAVNFIDRARTHAPKQPFFLEVATFSPHSRVGGDAKEPTFPAARRDRPGREFKHGDCGKGVDCRTVKSPRTNAFDEDTADKPGWVRRAPLTQGEKTAIDEKFRDRVRMVQSLDDMIGKVVASLDAKTAANTYVMFSADNGFHLGQHRLLTGKGTAYDHDINVPLVIKGPGVPAGKTRNELAQNVDLSPTFQQMAGAKPAASDGRGLLNLAKGRNEPWRDLSFVEHTRDAKRTGDPDDDQLDQAKAGDNAQPPTYKAVRTATETYVEYATGAKEYYDLAKDPHQLTNTFDKLSAKRRDELHKAVERLRDCGKPKKPSCWDAAQFNGPKASPPGDDPTTPGSGDPSKPDDQPSTSPVAAPGTGGSSLPLTGFALGGLIAVAALAIAGGVLLLIAARRRRNATVS